MSNVWQVTTRGGVGSAATVSVPASGNLTYQTRLRSMYCTLISAAGSGTLVVRDGASGVGTIVFRNTVSLPSTGIGVVSKTDLDLRSTAGNLLTIEFLAGTASDYQCINAQGDYVAVGTPRGETMIGP